jgi:hypothetical protein
MKPGAHIIISVPNVANIVVRLALLFGRFPYADAGIIDKGHLRFFTLASARTLIRGCGFKIVKVCPTPLPVFLFAAKGSLKGIGGMFETLFYALTRLLKTLLAYQFVFVAVPDEECLRTRADSFPIPG